MRCAQYSVHGRILMKQSRLVEANLKLSQTLMRRILEDPSYLEEIPEDANVIVLPLDNPELFKANLEQLLSLKERGVENLLVVVLESAEVLEPRVVMKIEWVQTAGSEKRRNLCGFPSPPLDFCLSWDYNVIKATLARR